MYSHSAAFFSLSLTKSSVAYVYFRKLSLTHVWVVFPSKTTKYSGTRMGSSLFLLYIPTQKGERLPSIKTCCTWLSSMVEGIDEIVKLNTLRKDNDKLREKQHKGSKVREVSRVNILVPVL